MKNVLIVSPHFPPVNTPDLHRVRMSLPYFAEHGWRPWVLAVDPAYVDAPVDPELSASLPDVPVTRIRALPSRLTRRIGIGDLGLRAAFHLYRAGAALMRRHDIDLVYFSTTVFTAVPLGRLWKRRFGVPYVIDFQDPWVSTFHVGRPASERPPKYALSQRLHAWLEPWTMRGVSGVIAVSEQYVETLRERYPWLSTTPCATIPFGASARDFDAAATATPDADGRLHAVSVGRGGADLATALRILLRAVRRASEAESRCATMQLRFLGTDYAHGARARKTIEPVAAEEELSDQVVETTGRIGYMESLATMKGADLLLLIGSEDQQYSPSKVYPYLFAKRPIVAILHAKSPLVGLLRRAGAGPVITFLDRDGIPDAVRELSEALVALVRQLPCAPSTDWSVVAPYSASELTRQQCRVFDAVLEPHRAAAAVPCAG